MRGYIGITDRQWFNNLKKQYMLNEVNFWRKNTNSFKRLSFGETFFFLVKNVANNREERQVWGMATFIRYEVLSIEEAWGKYKEGNGVNSEKEFYLKMRDMYKDMNNNIGCIILNNVKFFDKAILLSKLNINFQNSIVSGKGIKEEEVIRIFNESNINKENVIEEENNKYSINEEMLHSEFWRKFIRNAFEDEKFNKEFNKRIEWGKAYYDLCWSNSKIHLCLRHNLRGNYVAVEIYIEEDKVLYNYLDSRKTEIESMYGKELIFKDTRGKEGQVGKACKIYDTYNCGEVCDRSNWNNYIQWIKEVSLKLKEIVRYFVENLENNQNIIIDKDRDSINASIEWIIPCNATHYDVMGAFNELKKIEWKQSVNVKMNDIVYIYIGNPYKEIKYKCIARKVDLTSAGKIDHSKFIKDDTNFKNTGRYMELELIEKYDEQQFPLCLLKEKGVKSVQGPFRIGIELSKYINSIGCNEIYEREVISIPAAGTIDLIYKYRVHAHPNDESRYPYKKALFYTFREKNGVMTKLYELNTIILLNSEEITKLDSLDINPFIKERVKSYIKDRRSSFTFDEEGEYKFYVLSESIDLMKKVALPKQNNQSYFTVEEIFSGKQELDRCNYNTNNSKSDLLDIIKGKSNIDYVEIEDEDIDINLEIVEGNVITKLIEVKKRNSVARKLKLESFRSINGNLYCEVCGIEDEVVLDVHHDKVSVSDMEEGHVTKLEDLRIVCANCHRRVHGYKISVDRLKELEEKKK